MTLLLVLLSLDTYSWGIGRVTYFRILNVSDTKKTILTNQGKEEGLSRNDFVQIITNEKEVIATAKIVKAAPIRSIWQLIEIKKGKTLKKDDVYLLKIISPIAYTPDNYLIKTGKNLDEIILHLPWTTPWRVNIMIGSGNRNSSNYTYSADRKSSNHGQRYLFTSLLSKQIGQNNQFYWGGIFSVTSQKNSFLLQNQQKILEKSSKISIGPQVSFDIYGTLKHRFSIFTALPIHLFHQTTINQQNLAGENDNLTFSGISYSLMAGVLYSRLRVFKKWDFIAGIISSSNFPHTLQTGEAPAQPTYWSSDKIENKYTTSFTYNIGIQLAI